MARQPRIALAGRPHLVSQSSRRSAGAFIDDEDRRFYLAAMFESSYATGVVVHAYALAARQVQLLATPATADALGRFMQRLGRRYGHAFNRRHASAGPLWSSRYGATAILSEQFLLEALLTVEQLPIREGVLSGAHDWPWSSATHHIGRQLDSRLVFPHVYWALGNTPFERQARYAELLERMVSVERAKLLETAARSGWPTGTRDDIALLEANQRGLRLRPQPRGRPKTVG